MEHGTPRNGRRRRLRLRGKDAAVPAPDPARAEALRPAAGSDPEAAATWAARPVDPVVDGLHVCPECRSPLVQPRDWHDAGPDHWLVERFCPDCWWTAEERFEQAVMEAFDVALDDGTDVLIRTLHKLTSERMQDQVERFTAALYADALLPEDF